MAFHSLPFFLHSCCAYSTAKYGIQIARRMLLDIVTGVLSLFLGLPFSRVCAHVSKQDHLARWEIF